VTAPTPERRSGCRRVSVVELLVIDLARGHRHRLGPSVAANSTQFVEGWACSRPSADGRDRSRHRAATTA